MDAADKDESEEELDGHIDQILHPEIVHYCCWLLQTGREVSDAVVAVVMTEPKARKSGH
jgi:hypothetical protein